MMATAAQLEGRTDYRTARAKLAAAERSQQEALTDAADAQAQLDAARREGDQAAIEAATALLATARAALAEAGRAGDTAEKAIAAARGRALAGGGGFDLLSAKHPLLLLPVRIETRFAWPDAAGNRSFAPITGTARSLLIRIYPDDVHDDAHEPELTPTELEVIGTLEKRLRLARDLRDLDDAWSDVARAVGPTRAGWLGEVLGRGVEPGRRPGRLSGASVARLLPDTWTAFVELTDGSTRTADSGQVREPLETGPSPTGMDWMIDFDSGLDAGMALVVPDLADSPVEVRRVVVVGVRGTLDPAESAAELEHLLDAQHYTRGCGFVAPGTPTNCLPGLRAGYTARPQLADVLAIERRRFLIGWRPSPLCTPYDGTDARNLADALGIRTDPFGYLERADATEAQRGRDIRLLLAEVTRRHLTRMLDGILSADHVNDIVDTAIEAVSATGPFPTMRVGSQPYGILPVLLRGDARIPAGSLPAQMMPVLDALRAQWAAAAAALPRVGAAGADPGDTLIRILQRDAVTRRVAFRPQLGPELSAEVVAGLGPRAAGLGPRAAGLGPRAAVEAARAAAAAAIDALGASDSINAPLLQTLHLDFAAPLGVPFVEPPDVEATSSQRAAVYLELAAATAPDRLLAHDYGGAERPSALLFAIARLAMLERADSLARSAFIQAGADPAEWDNEDVPSVFRDYLATPQRRLEYADPLGTGASVAFQMTEGNRDAGQLGDLREALRRLADAPPEAIEHHLRASLGLFSHRLDPWYTALAADRLRELRNDSASVTGVNIGAYGVVEHLREAPRQPVAGSPGLYTSPINGGYVHAPSVGQGAAAAVLRSVHLAHAAAGHGAAFSVDLSSARVRLGLELLEGIRGGQPLAALLGYRIERELAREGLQPFIARLRSAAPLVAHQLTPGTEPVESVAATNVADGLRVLELAGYDGSTQPTLVALLAGAPEVGPVQPAQENGLNRVLSAAADALDSVADLAVAESVYQAVQGSPARAGGTVDGLSGAPVPPPEIGIVRTPRTGVGVTHRLLVLLDSAGQSGWAASPRALAEPRLEAWARTALPAPANVRLRARFIDANGDEVATLDKLTLSALMKAEPGLGLGALDVVLVADPHETPHQSPLELRLAALIESKRPAGSEDATLELVFERAPGWATADFGLVETLEIGRALRTTITQARPLQPADLAAPSDSPATAFDAVDLASRAVAATTALDGAVTSVADALAADEKARDGGSADPAALRSALFAADLFGVAGAAPATVRDSRGKADESIKQREREYAGLRHQAAAAVAELRRRKAAAVNLPASDATGRLRAVFGEAFVVLPVLTPASEALAAFAPGALPGGATPALARAWLGRAAPVRESVRALDATLGYSDALAAVGGNAAVPTLHVGQLGGASGERWVALGNATGERTLGGRVSLVAVTPGPQLPTGTPAGLFVDEWLEVVPSAEETTSVSFHYDAPTAAAPQVWLLGAPPPGFEAWAPADALRVVQEALELAQLRMVEADDVPDLGQLLPAFVTAENPAGDSIGLDVEHLTEVQE